VFNGLGGLMCVGITRKHNKQNEKKEYKLTFELHDANILKSYKDYSLQTVLYYNHKLLIM